MAEKQGRTNLIIEHLTVAYEEKLAVDDVSFSLENGKIFVIVGESGSGKTTLLRTVGGLLSDEGKIVSGNIFLQEKKSGRTYMAVRLDTFFRTRSSRSVLLLRLENSFWNVHV